MQSWINPRRRNISIATQVIIFIKKIGISNRVQEFGFFIKSTLRTAEASLFSFKRESSCQDVLNHFVIYSTPITYVVEFASTDLLPCSGDWDTSLQLV